MALFIPNNFRNTLTSSVDQEVIIKQHLRKQLSTFRRGWLTQSGWKNLLHDNDENKLYNDMSIFDIRNKCKYLSKAIENTIINISIARHLNAVVWMQSLKLMDLKKLKKLNLMILMDLIKDGSSPHQEQS